MRPPRADSRFERYEPPRTAPSAAEPPLADRLTRALDVDDVVTVVGLLTLAEDSGIAALPPPVLERLRESTVREIARVRDAKRMSTRLVPR